MEACGQFTRVNEDKIILVKDVVTNCYVTCFYSTCTAKLAKLMGTLTAEESQPFPPPPLVTI
jgi:hypothetical protein